MKFDEIESDICSTIKQAFPNVIVMVSTPHHLSEIMVSVFSVQPNDVGTVTDLILDLDEKYCIMSNGEFCVIPLVRNMEVTKKHYPQYL